jgi:sec-independent protein translocase protein TatC
MVIRRRLRPPGDREMPFLDHLEELRRAVLDSLWAVLAASAAGWYVSPRALDILIRPAGSLVFLGPADALNLRIKVAFFVGLVLASPFVLWRLWSFVAPGLVAQERRVVGPLVFVSSALFLTGVAFAHWVIAPLTFRFLLSFQSETLKPFLTAAAYFDFLAKLCLAFGLFFQLPVVMTALVGSGLVPLRFFTQRWREAVVVILVIAAIASPPDVVSQMVMAGPIFVLYAVSLGAASLVHARAPRRGARVSDAAAPTRDETPSPQPAEGEPIARA